MLAALQEDSQEPLAHVSGYGSLRNVPAPSPVSKLKIPDLADVEAMLASLQEDSQDSLARVPVSECSSPRNLASSNVGSEVEVSPPAVLAHAKLHAAHGYDRDEDRPCKVRRTSAGAESFNPDTFVESAEGRARFPHGSCGSGSQLALDC